MNGDMVAECLDDDDLEMDENGGVASKHMKLLENLFSKFEGYCNELAVFGFNSAGYDVKLIKKFLIKELSEHKQQPTFTVKKAGNRKNDLILIMTPEKQDKILELSKHWSADSTPTRNEVIMKTTYPVKSVKCNKICSNY